MKEILKINNSFFNNSESFFYNNEIINKIKNSIKKKKLITINGLNSINKTSYINLSINNSINNIFYFNKNLDFYNKIKSDIELTILIKEFTLTYSKADYIALENISKIDNIKSFISKFYKSGYKIIIIDNNIAIPSKPKIEIKNPKYYQIKQKLENNYNINDFLIFGDNENTILVNNKKIKINLLETQRNQILLKDLIEIYSIKNTFLLNQTITFLSLLNKKTTLREMHRDISENIKISLVTLIEYIDFLLNSKLIKRVYSYDFKKEKTIKTKAKYYFSDLGIRNSFNFFTTSKKTAIENLIFNELDKKGFKIKSAINGKFEFDFYAKKKSFNEEKNTKKIDKIYLHISKAENKQELKKEINKLNKVPYFPTFSKSGENIDEIISRYLIVDNIKNLGIKKLQYDEVKIMELEEFLMMI